MMRKLSAPQKGEVYLAALDPTVGRELQKTRPAVVVSNNHFNELTEMVIIMPITSGQHKYVHDITINPPEGGLRKPSRIVTEQVRSVDKDRLGKKLGNVRALTLFAIEETIKDHFGLPESNLLP